MTDAVRAALVVVTLDRADRFAACVLPGLRASVDAGHDVLVVDQGGPASGTARLLRRHPTIRVIHSPRGLSVGRNAALDATTAPVVVFTDDDVRLPDRWVEAMLRPFESEVVGAVCGRARAVDGRLLPGAESGSYTWPTSPFGLGSGFALALRRDAVDSVGHFDVSLGAGARYRAAEDTDMLYRLLREGWTVACIDDATVVHDDGRNRRGQLRQYYGYGLGAGAQLAGQACAGDERAAQLRDESRSAHAKGAVRSIVRGRLWSAVLQVPYLLGMRRGWREGVAERTSASLTGEQADHAAHAGKPGADR